MKIYAFDDEESVRGLYGRFGNNIGVPVTVFNDPSHLKGQSLERIAQEFADVAGVFTDREMPEMDGFELTALLRNAGYKGPVALVSGGMETADVNAFLQLAAKFAGCEHYILHKPVNWAEIASLMKRWTAPASQ